MCATAQIRASGRTILPSWIQIESGRRIMIRRLEYRVSRRAKYVVTRLERKVDGNGRQSGSLRVVGKYDSAADAERARAALQSEEERPEPACDGT